jgi:hypothetical protein
MNLILLATVVLSLSSPLSYASGKSPVPKSLFGVELGKVFTASIANPAGNLPIKRWTGSKRVLGAGIHYYFEPLKEYKAFEYVEKRDHQDNDYFETSFSLYNFQLIPENIQTITQFDEQETFDFLVSKINWEVPIKDESKGYFWAIDICNVLASDLRVEPQILDMGAINDYRCIFREDDRELEVWSFGNISLQYVREKFDRLNDKFQNRLNQLRANEIKPY